MERDSAKEIMRMSQPEVEALATKTLLLLFEVNGSDNQMEHVKALLNLFINEKKLPHEEIVLAKVKSDAVLLKSVKITEKGFPLVYFIQPRKFLGYHEVANSKAKVEEYLKQDLAVKEEVIDALRSFFRGCLVIENANLVEALRTVNTEEKPANPNLPEPGLGSKLIENTVWTVRWGFDSAWNYASSLYSGNTSQGNSGKDVVVHPGAQEKYTDVTVLRYNWYGRAQKRLYRFWDDYFERIDPEGSRTGGELVKAAYKYSDVSKITIENSTDLVIYFRDPRLDSQWLQTAEANKIITMICNRAPWTASVTVVRNMEVKMEKHGVSTLQIHPSAKVISPPRWHKDGLSLAYEDELGWKSIDLETIDMEADSWMARDIVHFPKKLVQGEITSPLGKCSKHKCKVLNADQLAKDFNAFEVTTISYANATGLRTQHAGFIAETTDNMGSSSMLFVCKASEFNGKWQQQHQKLHIFDNKCGAPSLSPDGKFVAFVEDNERTIIIHKVEFLTHSTFMFLGEHEIDLEETLFQIATLHVSKKKPAAPTSSPALTADKPLHDSSPRSSFERKRAEKA